MVVLGEESTGGGIIDVAGHDVPGDGLVMLTAVGQKLLGEDLEQRLVLDGGDGVLPLGPIIAQAGALSAGDEGKQRLCPLAAAHGRGPEPWHRGLCALGVWGCRGRGVMGLISWGIGGV